MTVAACVSCVTGDGSTTFSSGATFAHADQGSRSGLIISFKEAAAAVRHLTAAAGSYTLTGTAAGLARTHAAARRLCPDRHGGSVCVQTNGRGGRLYADRLAAGINYRATFRLRLLPASTRLPAFPPAPRTASAALTASPAPLLRFLRRSLLTAAVGAYTLTGTAATFLTGGNFTLFCDPGAYTLTGSAASFPGNEPLPPVVTTPPGGNYTGAGRGRMIRQREKRKEDRRDELEELLELVAQPAVQPDPKIPQIPQPSPPGLSALMEQAELTPPQRKVVQSRRRLG